MFSRFWEWSTGLGRTLSYSDMLCYGKQLAFKGDHLVIARYIMTYSDIMPDSLQIIFKKQLLLMDSCHASGHTWLPFLISFQYQGNVTYAIHTLQIVLVRFVWLWFKVNS